MPKKGVFAQLVLIRRRLPLATIKKKQIMKAVKLTTTLFLVFSLFLISSCEKNDLNEYPDFEGTWFATENYTESLMTDKTIS